MTNASTTLTDISFEEWNRVAWFIGATGPAELAADSGVQLSMRHGRRLWTITAAGVRIDVTGGAENPGITQPILVSPRLVVLAAELAGDTLIESCGFGVDDEAAVIGCAAGGARFDHPSGELVGPLRPADRPPAEAQVTADRVTRLLRATRRVPRGIDLSVLDAPALWLSFGPDGLDAGVDWSGLGAGRCTVSVPALVNGSATVAVAPAPLSALVDHLDDDEVLDIGCFHDGSLHVSGDGWTALVGAPDSSGVEAIDLDAAVIQLDGRLVDDDVYELGVGDSTVRIDFDPTLPEMVRLRTVIAQGVPATLEVLTELNHLTGGLYGFRLWWEAGDVLAGSDLHVDDLHHLDAAVVALTEGTTSLGPLVASLADHADHADFVVDTDLTTPNTNTQTHTDTNTNEEGDPQ